MDNLTTEEAGYLCVALGRVMRGHNAPLSTLIGSNRNCVGSQNFLVYNS